MSLFKVLSIDGGGMRGLLPATVLAEIERRTGQPISKLFNLVAGSSAGGLLALGLCKPQDNGPQYKASDLVNLYMTEGPRIFHRSPARTLCSLDGMIDEKYSADGLEDVLEEYFGEARLSEAITDVILPSYELGSRQAFFFKSRKARGDLGDDFLMRQAARATSAAPTYFEPPQFNSALGELAFTDGGVVANSPAMCAYAEARKHYPQATDILLVSLGTGDSAKPISYANARDWGIAQWLAPLISVFLDGMADAVNYQMIQCLPDGADGRRRYYRLQIPLGQVSDSLDEVSSPNMRALQMLANDVVRLNSDVLDELCEQLVAQSEPFEAAKV
jgi:uncharacterized protein